MPYLSTPTVFLVFGIAFVLVAVLAVLFVTSFWAWIQESTRRTYRHFFCRTKNTEVDVVFRPHVFSRQFRDVEKCSAFDDQAVTCEKDCLHEEHL